MEWFTLKGLYASWAGLIGSILAGPLAYAVFMRATRNMRRPKDD